MGYRVAIVGATGAVGRELLSVLSQRKFPVSELSLFASKESEGQKISFDGKNYKSRILETGCFKDVQIAFFDASDEVSQGWVQAAVDHGAWVIDNSSTFRLESDIPLIVPEVNSNILVERLKSKKYFNSRERIVAGPNCTTVQLAVALKPVLERWGIKRVVISSYQSTSGAGIKAMEELKEQTKALLEESPIKTQVFPHPIAFNCIPQIGSFRNDGYTSEEYKLMEETKKILNAPNLKITATAVRVPTLWCHGESVNVECEKSFTFEELKKAFSSQDGLQLQDEPSLGIYPMGIGAMGRDPVCVGRVRIDPSIENGLNLWIVSDNLRKGAALNAVQVGEILADYNVL